MTQAGWSVTGNANYISIGGEFPRVDGKAQQGLVRFAIRSVAPNKVGPRAFPGAVTATTAGSSGTSTVTFPTTWDKDNAVLTYRLYRDGGSTPVHTVSIDTRFWKLPKSSFVDQGLAPGSTHTYRITATDPLGNVRSLG